MKKYNKEKRAGYKAYIHTHAYHKHDTHDAYNPYKYIHISPRYDTYNSTTYIVEFARSRDTHAQQYIAITNAINDIFPDINAPHNAHTYAGVAPYRKYIIGDTNIQRPRQLETPSTYTDTKRAKCMVYNKRGEFIYAGHIRRTIEIYDDTVTVTLHMADRHMRVYPYMPTEGRCGFTVEDLRKYGVEFYHI